MQAVKEHNAKGIDISQWQGVINWSQAKNEIDFCIIKATEGHTFIDPMFEQNIASCQQHNITKGAYHYLRATSPQEAIQEAQFYCQVVGNRLDITPILDAEETQVNKSEFVAIIHAWMHTVEQFYQVTPILYTYPRAIRNYMDESLSIYPLWLASYDTTQPPDCLGWNEWTFLQYTDRGQIKGIHGNVDVNYFKGSAEELNYQMKKEDADKLINLLSGVYQLLPGDQTSDTGSAEIHRLGNELRKASGQVPTDPVKTP